MIYCSTIIRLLLLAKKLHWVKSLVIAISLLLGWFLTFLPLIISQLIGKCYWHLLFGYWHFFKGISQGLYYKNYNHSVPKLSKQYIFHVFLTYWYCHTCWLDQIPICYRGLILYACLSIFCYYKSSCLWLLRNHSLFHLRNYILQSCLYLKSFKKSLSC